MLLFHKDFFYKKSDLCKITELNRQKTQVNIGCFPKFEIKLENGMDIFKNCAIMGLLSWFSPINFFYYILLLCIFYNRKYTAFTGGYYNEPQICLHVL